MPKGALPIMAHTGRLRPKGVPFSGFRFMKGSVSISLVEECQRVGNLSSRSVRLRDLKGLIGAFLVVKKNTRKLAGLVVYSY